MLQKVFGRGGKSSDLCTAKKDSLFKLQFLFMEINCNAK